MTSRNIYRGDYKFTRHEVDLSLVSNVNREIIVSGNLLVVSNNLISMGGAANDPITPTIQFNDLNAPPLNILPFSIFRLPYGKVIINSAAIVTSSTDLNIADPLILYSALTDDINIFNFRDSSTFILAQNPGSQVNVNRAFNIPIPIGASSCILTAANNGAVADVVMTVQLYHRNMTYITIFISPGLGDLHLPIDIRGYESIRISYITSVGDPTGVLRFYLRFQDK